MSTRTNIEKEIYELFDDLDPSGRNTARMKDLFKSMDDKRFYRYMDSFFNDPEQNFTCSYIPCDNPVTIEFIEKVANKHDIKIYEYMYMPYMAENPDDPNGRIPITPNPVMVLVYPVKRLKQMGFLKAHSGISNTHRNAETGQVSEVDKTTRETDNETYSLIVQNQYNAAAEFYGPRADDMPAKYEMERRIQRDGECYLADLPNRKEDKTTLNTIYYYLLSAGLATNLMDETGYVLPGTLRNRSAEDTTIKRN